MLLSDIVERFKEGYSLKAESIPVMSPNVSEQMPLEDIMDLWNSHREDPDYDVVAEAAANESAKANSEHETPEPEEDAGDSEEEFTMAELSTYRDVVFNSTAYQWLLARLRRELLLATTVLDCMEDLRRGIATSLPRSPKVSRYRSAEAHQMTFRVSWDPVAFIGEQGYGDTPDEALERAITLTGSASDAQALTCAQYLRQTWPWVAELTMQFVKDIVRGQPGERHRCKSSKFKWLSPYSLTAFLQVIYLTIRNSRRGFRTPRLSSRLSAQRVASWKLANN